MKLETVWLVVIALLACTMVALFLSHWLVALGLGVVAGALIVLRAATSRGGKPGE